MINTDIKNSINEDDKDSFFDANFNEETKHYDNLGLYVAKEISTLLNSDLVVKNDENGNLVFLFSLPYQIEKDTRLLKDFTLKDESKRILIVDSNKNNNKLLENIVKDFKMQSKTVTKDEFISNTPDFSSFDILMLDENLFSNSVTQNLQYLQKNEKIKVISLENIFSSTKNENSKISDVQLKKPTTLLSVYNTLEALYPEKQNNKDKTNFKSEIPVHREIFKDTADVTLEKFAIFRGANILLVEDNLINQKVLISILGKSGIIITVAHNGQEAINMVKSTNHHFDLVLMDINMPIMDGYTATQIIRKDQKYNKLPIISLSALTSADEVNKMFNVGMNGFLAKPFYKEKLFTVFSTFLHQNEPTKLRKAKKDRRVQNIKVKHDRRVSKHDRRAKHEEIKITQLDGLNIDKGITQNNGNIIFFIEVLKEFKDAYGESDQTFEKLVNDFRFEQVKMLCLDIKGLSGAIGATDMHDLATEILQRLLFKKYELLPNFINEYKERLATLNTSIDKYIEFVDL
jgi:CheY-like chemotaxis protein